MANWERAFHAIAGQIWKASIFEGEFDSNRTNLNERIHKDGTVPMAAPLRFYMAQPSLKFEGTGSGEKTWRVREYPSDGKSYLAVEIWDDPDWIKVMTLPYDYENEAVVFPGGIDAGSLNMAALTLEGSELDHKPFRLREDGGDLVAEEYSGDAWNELWRADDDYALHMPIGRNAKFEGGLVAVDLGVIGAAGLAGPLSVEGVTTLTNKLRLLGTSAYFDADAKVGRKHLRRYLVADGSFSAIDGTGDKEIIASLPAHSSKIFICELDIASVAGGWVSARLKSIGVRRGSGDSAPSLHAYITIEKNGTPSYTIGYAIYALWTGVEGDE